MTRHAAYSARPRMSEAKYAADPEDVGRRPETIDQSLVRSDDLGWPSPVLRPASRSDCVSSLRRQIPAATSYLDEIQAARAWSIPERASRDIPARCWRQPQRPDTRAHVAGPVLRTGPNPHAAAAA